MIGALAVPAVIGQSARVRPTPTPTPENPRGVYQPTQINKGRTDPTPTPTPISVVGTEDDDGDLIRVNAALVPIPVSVLDAGGRALTNLKLEDFVLTINGQAAEISDLYRSDTPVRLALLFDNSSSVTQARDFEIKAAKRFFRRVLRPDRDLAALYSVAGITQLEQPLTSDISALLRAIENFAQPQGATALLDGIIESANYLQDFQGRRVIVIVSDGEDTISNLETTLEKVVRTVQAANCQIYVVKTTEFENYKRTGQRSGSANLRYLAAERRMQELAAQTGGAVYSPIDEVELDDAFSRISAELSQQYILSYYPGDETGSGGEFREISVDVREKANLTIRTRKGYYVPKVSSR